MGMFLKTKLLDLQRQFPSIVREVRGCGLMVGMELTREGNTIANALRDGGIVLNCTKVNVLPFVPPLSIGQKHIEHAVETLRPGFVEQ